MDSTFSRTIIRSSREAYSEIGVSPRSGPSVLCQADSMSGTDIEVGMLGDGWVLPR